MIVFFFVPRFEAKQGLCAADGTNTSSGVRPTHSSFRAELPEFKICCCIFYAVGVTVSHLSKQVQNDHSAPCQRRVKHILVFQHDQGGHLPMHMWRIYTYVSCRGAFLLSEPSLFAISSSCKQTRLRSVGAVKSRHMSYLHTG